MGPCALEHLLEHLFLRSERLYATIRDCQNQVDAQQGRWTVGNDDHDGSTFACPKNRLRQRFVAFGIEVGIRFIEHDEKRISIERARQCNALALASRDRYA